MTASKQSDADGEKAPIMKTWCSGDADGDGRPCTFARLRTGRCESTAVFGEGAETEVVVDGDVLQVTLTVTGLEEMAELVNRDVLSVELAAKDLPENRE